MGKWWVIVLLLLPCVVKGQVITTVAGDGTPGHGGDGGPATAASVGNPGFIIFDAYNNYYFTDYNYTVRKVSASGIINTIAGNGTSGSSGDGGYATSAQFNQPSYIAIDFLGNLYISDIYNNKIRKINIASGIVTTFAGNGTGTFAGDGGMATAASLYSPAGIAFDSHDNLYIAEIGNQRIRKVNTSGVISTIAGIGIVGSSGDGGPATSAAIDPYGLYIDASDDLYFCDINKIRKINIASGIINTVAGNGTSGFSGDGGLATNAELFFPQFITMDSFGNLYISDVDNNRTRIVNSQGIINTIVGSGIGAYGGDNGPASVAKLYSPRGIALDSCGNLYIADNGNGRIRKVTYPHCHYLDIKEPQIQSNFSISPNPAYNELTITANTPIANIAITNLLGKMVYTKACNAEKVEVGVAGLPAGVYVLRATDGEGNVVVRRFLKE